MLFTTLPETNIAMENLPFWWYLPGKMGIFMGYVSFKEGIHAWKKQLGKEAIMLRKARKSVLKTWVGRVVGFRWDKNKQWEVYMQKFIFQKIRFTTRYGGNKDIIRIILESIWGNQDILGYIGQYRL